MAQSYHAIAIDYDGTLTEEDQPRLDVLAALAEVRAAGVKVILVTGRVFSELAQVFPGVDDCFDFIVAENGAVLRFAGVSRAVTAPVPFELDEPLVSQGIAFKRGQVLLACDGEHEVAVLKELRRIGSDCQLIRNREALMVLPAGVSKASGVSQALRELGLSYHSAVAIGDAENDLALL
ncbi:MAG: HAD family phosphatase, partial [Deltaproteobacteria bacterium]|nr:HAD family phosphatase [Deltaproteobacteria bacterium]